LNRVQRKIRKRYFRKSEDDKDKNEDCTHQRRKAREGEGEAH